MWTPEPGQDAEVVIRGRVIRLACHGHAALLELPDGQHRWFEIRHDLINAVEWRPAP